MPVTADELNRFSEFARAQLQNGGAESLQELVDLWQARHPDEAELQESLACLNRGIADAEAGRVRPAEEVFADLARRYAAVGEQ